MSNAASSVKFSRRFVFTAGLVVWTIVLVQIFSSTAAQSNTPFIDNVRRAINACKVIGRLASEEQNGNSYVSFNSRLLCLNAQQAQPVAPQR
jgi:hypothetical protein